MDSECKTILTGIAAGVSELNVSVRELRGELAEIRRILEGRQRVEVFEDSRRVEGEARFREGQVEHAQIVAERQEPLSTSRDQQTSQSQSKLGSVTPVHRRKQTEKAVCFSAH